MYCLALFLIDSLVNKSFTVYVVVPITILPFSSSKNCLVNLCWI
nr:MAG TPA: hypothetical protein [Caudoviricetes sp.]